MAKQWELFTAARNGCLERVQELLNEGVSIDSLDWNGDTIVHCACSRGHYQLTEFLISSGANLRRKNSNGHTPLHLARDFNIVNLLLDSGSKMHDKGCFGDTPFHLACSRKNLDVIQLYLDYGAQLSIQNNRGDTPLHVACSTGDYFASLLLIEEGADINIQSKTGDTPLHVAAPRYDVVSLLLDHGVDHTTQNQAGKLFYDMVGDNDKDRLLKLLHFHQHRKSWLSFSMGVDRALTRGHSKLLSPTLTKILNNSDLIHYLTDYL